MNEEFLNIEEVSKMFKLAKKTIRLLDSKLQPVRTEGGHRRYRLSKLNEYFGSEDENSMESDSLRYATYARVSSFNQKTSGDLGRQSERLQEYCTAHGYDVMTVIEDVGSGLNDSRKGFNQLVSLVFKHKIDVVVIEHKDRLTRFQYNFIKRVFKTFGCQIETVDDTTMTDADELTTDMMSLIASFSGKYYGKRSASQCKKN